MSLKLKRFSEAKQAQVEQLIGYAQLLGLKGDDLVSIGGKMQREAAKTKKVENMKIIQGFVCRPIGRSGMDINRRFKLEGASSHYRFETRGSIEIWSITNTQTKQKIDVWVKPWEHELPKTDYFTKSRYALLLDIASGKIQLNF